MRGSMRKNLWSSIAREDIYKVACARRRAQRDCPTTPTTNSMLLSDFVYLRLRVEVGVGRGFGVVTESVGGRACQARARNAIAFAIWLVILLMQLYFTEGQNLICGI